MIRWTCQSCAKVLRAKDANAGKKTACPNCKALVLIPPLDHLRTAVTEATPPVDLQWEELVTRMAEPESEAAPEYIVIIPAPTPLAPDEPEPLPIPVTSSPVAKPLQPELNSHDNRTLNLTTLIVIIAISLVLIAAPVGGIVAHRAYQREEQDRVAAAMVFKQKTKEQNLRADELAVQHSRAEKEREDRFSQERVRDDAERGRAEEQREERRRKQAELEERLSIEQAKLRRMEEAADRIGRLSKSDRQQGEIALKRVIEQHKLGRTWLIAPVTFRRAAMIDPDLVAEIAEIAARQKFEITGKK